MNPAIDLLRRTRKRIESPDRWCQGFFGMSKTGKRVIPESADAVRWCLMGALMAETGDDMATYMQAANALNYTASEAIIHFNDTHEHAEVLAMIDRTIEGLEKLE